MAVSKIFLYFCLSFIGGIFLNSIVFISQLNLLGLLIAGISLVSVFWKYQKLAVIGFSILFLVLGIYHYQAALLKIVANELQKYNDKNSPVVLIGLVSAEPDTREDNQKLTIKPEGIEGKILVTTNLYPSYRYGDKLKIKGELKTPKEFEDFNYKDYLAKEGIYSVIYWPEIELIGREQGNFIYSQILSFKEKLREGIYQNISPPQSLILGAIILGDKKRISSEWKEKLNLAGIRHLTAVSGMHVAILTSILMTLLIGLGLWRGQAFYLAIIFITFFIIMTGLQPSAVRAGIMGGLFLLAQYLGRKGVSSRLLVFTGAVMLIQNPLLLRLDVGFQLSFLAMLGIIYLSPIFQKYLGNILALTLSAQVFTLPILIYNFGYFSLVAPFTNVLIVPFLPFLMSLGFIFAVSGVIWQSLGWVLSFPAKLLLIYLTKIVDWFSSFSWSAYHLDISWIWLLVAYLVLGLVTWRITEKQKLKFLNY